MSDAILEYVTCLAETDVPGRGRVTLWRNVLRGEVGLALNDCDVMYQGADSMMEFLDRVRKYCGDKAFDKIMNQVMGRE